MEIPPSNPLTVGKIGLGKQLFFDKRLSRNDDMSCETCHLPEMGWTDGKALSTRFNGVVNTRHTPTLYNVGYYREWYWDGRAPTLEAQILAAWESQMGGVPDEVAAKLNAIPAYRLQFEQHLGGPATAEKIPQALAAFVRTLISDDAPWDRYEKGIDRGAVTADAIAGFEVFSRKANCTLCHLPPIYSDALYHNVGIGFDRPNPDQGRGAFLQRSVPELEAEARLLSGAFKTPTLRSVTETAPYFHDGRTATLEEAVDLMIAGGIPNPQLDQKLKPVQLTAEERRQLIAFLQSLTPQPQPFVRPQLP
jgi:cytochrome c peroxidase